MKAVVLDLDDTLYAEQDYVRGGFEAVDRLITLTFGVSGFFDQAWSHFRSGARGTVFNASLEYLGLPVDDDIITGLVSVYRAHTPRISLFHDAETFLNRLQGYVHFAVLSDGALNSQFQKYNALALDTWCETQVFTDLFGRHAWKPSVEAYERIESKLPHASDFLYIADNPSKDFVVAKKRGWSTIRMRRPGCEHYRLMTAADFEAHLIVSSFDQIDTLNLMHS